jgi:hypothetical protein
MTALPLFFVAGLELALGWVLPPWIGWFAAWCGLSTGYVAVAYQLRRPGMLAKGSPLRWLLAPYLWFSACVPRIAQRLGLSERAEVVPGLWVGGWPRRGVSDLHQLDLTAELPRRVEAPAYRNIPMLDGAAPRPEDWRAAVEQALAWRADGRAVLVHCAYGHGRSVAVVVGVLVREGHAPDTEAAMALVNRVRPSARLSGPQRRFMRAMVG